MIKQKLTLLQKSAQTGRPLLPSTTDLKMIDIVELGEQLWLRRKQYKRISRSSKRQADCGLVVGSIAASFFPAKVGGPTNAH